MTEVNDKQVPIRKMREHKYILLYVLTFVNGEVSRPNCIDSSRDMHVKWRRESLACEVR